METAIINKQGKGWTLLFTNGKSMPLNWTQVPPDWHGKTIQVKRENGQVKTLKNGEAIIESHAQSTVTNNRNHTFTQKRENPPKPAQERKPAKAPYNFVPLNEQVISVPPPPGADCFHNGYLSGYIDLEILTETSLFIRGNKEKFLMINNSPVIPGSSLRGMTRSLVEIVSWSKFQCYDDKRLSHRGMADMSSLKTRYLEAISEDIQIGYLYFNQDQQGYFIHPAANINDFREYPFTPYCYQATANGWKIYSGKMEIRKRGSRELDMNKTKQNHFQVDGKDLSREPVPVPREIVKAYINDDTQTKKFEKGKGPNDYYDVIDRLKQQPWEFKDGIPVFYNESGGKIISFGHTVNYRIPYTNSIADHVLPQKEHQKRIVDFTESMFGIAEKFSSRLFFEDGITANEHWKLSERLMQPKILSSPKPTTFQHYLEQETEGWETSPKDLKHWDDENTPIRGHKLYWHRNTPSDSNKPHSWVEREAKTKSHPEPVMPVKPGIIFTARIRFENLTKEELGCLLLVLDLPKDCRHKIGMGKPVGLGSIKITPTLTSITRKDRYTKLFDDTGWHTGAKPEPDIAFYKNAFARYMDRQLHKKEEEDNSYTFEKLWLKGRLQQLKTMLTFKQPVDDNVWLEETNYQKLPEFRSRPVLPKPDEVIQKLLKNQHHQ